MQRTCSRRPQAAPALTILAAIAASAACTRTEAPSAVAPADLDPRVAHTFSHTAPVFTVAF